MLFKERLDELNVHSVVLVGVSLESRSLKHFVSAATVVQELGVLLIIVLEAGDLTTLPCHVTQVN